MPTAESLPAADPAARLSDIPAVRAFALAGHALFTVRSLRTGARRTFKVSAKEGEPGFHFVSLLNGSDNTGDYKYLGALFTRRDNALGWKLNRQGWGVEAGAAFAWIVRVLNGEVPAAVAEASAEFWHEGRCGRCGRVLTTPESIASGIGPVCAGRD